MKPRGRPKNAKNKPKFLGIKLSELNRIFTNAETVIPVHVSISNLLIGELSQEVRIKDIKEVKEEVEGVKLNDFEIV